MLLLEFRISDLNKNRLQEKSFPLVFWNTNLKICQEEVYNDVILYKWQNYSLEFTYFYRKFTSYIFQGMFRKIFVLKVSENSQKNVFK